ncbi:ABC transporter ATP-binding protein/permease [Mycoplasma zalophi]|uniref:ABC transporter ATP-binding protein/permease n=1 Tax=Mycoplasma zalophi TaxID=191287 RepID=A0ABS6DPJ5_9MOLU|nr:ABC transporter ATP-binding protein [Mycoplasma zalophi]MBU4692173.1 ABC transporter ATP-binding protein/permease [Mycoplasma zalophi]
MWRIIKSMSLKYKLVAGLSILFTVLQISIFLLFPNLISQLIGQVATFTSRNEENANIIIKIIGIVNLGPYDSPTEAITHISILFIGTMILGVAFGMTATALSNYVGINVSKSLRQKLFYHIQSLNSEKINELSQEKLITNLTNDIAKIEDGVISSLRRSILGPIFFIGGFVFAILTNLKLSISFAVLIPLLLTLTGIIFWKGLPLFKKQQQITDQINLESRESINGIKVIKSYNLEKNQESKFTKISNLWLGVSIKSNLIQIFAFIITMILINISTVVILAIAGISRPNLENATPDVINEYQNFIVSINAFMGYLQVVTHGLVISIFVSVYLFRSQVSAKRYFSVIEIKNNLITNKNNTKQIDFGTIEFRNVCFRYFKDSEKRVLENLNFKIEAGQTIGIIGPTGSGKTTLANLLVHEWDVENGEILIDNQNVKEYNQENINSKISYVYQKPFLFSGTILKNMHLANQNATKEDIDKALKISDAYDFVYNFEDNLDHNISQGSTNISGGQRQRLFIAQALLKNPKILIFDDSTSALDNKTDKIVRQNIKENFKNLTTIIISQKLNSIREADKILVLEDGKMSGFDSHDNLLKTNKLYQEIFESQGGK